MKAFVTGCAGFIGSHLVDFLLSQGHEVVGVDNLSTGRHTFLYDACSNPLFFFTRLDLFTDDFDDLLQDVDIIYHCAANADVRFGAARPRRDLVQNTLVTHNLLESARRKGVSKFVFASTGSVYGDASIIPTPENSPFPIQTSLYGASKIAAEGLLTAYSTAYGIQSYIFRFVSILGPRYSHGHVYDFYKSLRLEPSFLKVLGDGRQRKSYLHIEDCISGINIGVTQSTDLINVFNLGTDMVCTVNESIDIICRHIGCSPQLAYSGGDRGWVGDSPLIHLDTSRIKALGWSPKHTINESIIATVDYLVRNQWLLDLEDV